SVLAGGLQIPTIDGQLARRDCRIVVQLVVIDPIFMVRESAAAVRLLHVIILDEMRRTADRLMLRKSLDKSHDAIFVPAQSPPRPPCWPQPPGSAARQRTIFGLTHKA